VNCDSSANRDSGLVTPITDLNVAMAARPPDETATCTGIAQRRFRTLLDAAEQLRDLLTAWRIEPTSGLTCRRTFGSITVRLATPLVRSGRVPSMVALAWPAHLLLQSRPGPPRIVAEGETPIQARGRQAPWDRMAGDALGLRDGEADDQDE
jgi:hypothetical protein